MIATDLRCESLEQAIGIDNPQPRLSWLIDDQRRGASQRAWQIEVRDAAGRRCWDSGRVDDERQHHIAYAGTALQSFGDYRWRVRLWNEADDEGPWSDEARFVCGFLGDDAFTADWIHYPVRSRGEVACYQRDITIDRPVARAFLALTARGIAEPWFDGERLADDYLQPGWTEYTQRIHYRVYDCTSRCTVGQHRLGAMLAEGWWRGQIGSHPEGRYGTVCMLLAELHLVYADGSVTTIGTGPDWSCRLSAHLQASLQHGETVDARRADPTWCRPGNDVGWLPVQTTPVGDGHWYQLRNRTWIEQPPLLSAHPAQPVRVVATVPAQSRHQVEPGSWVYDLGQNIAGVIRVQLAAPAGTLVRLRYGEMINPDGSLYVENLRSARATDTYICAGGDEVYQPRFTFHGFRYVEITGLATPPAVDQLQGLALASDTPETTVFSCSNPMLEQLHSNTRWTMRGNFIDIPTDCPQRDERLGWSGDAQVFASTACGLADVEAFYRKWMLDLADAQADGGGIPNVIPGFGDAPGADAAWGDVMTVLPTVVAERYGDPELLRAWLPRMRAFCDHYATAVGEDGCREGPHCFGDWLALDNPEDGNGGGTPKPLIQTAFYAYSCLLTARAATTCGDTATATDMAQRHARTAAAFRLRFMDADGRLEGDTQTAYVLALAFDLLEDGQQQRAIDLLAANIEAHDRCLTTGFVGVSYLLPVLERHGRADLAYALLENERFPSWGYSIANGATTIWERWNGWLEGQGPGDANMNSYSHYAYGSVMSFIYERVCGLRPLRPGYAQAEIAPVPGGSLSHASYRYRSIVGLWQSAWRRVGGGFRYELTVPPNAKAQCRLPLGQASDLREDGQALTERPGIEAVTIADGQLCCTLTAGTYVFDPV